MTDPYRNEGESLRGTINNLQTEINKLKMENTKLKEKIHSKNKIIPVKFPIILVSLLIGSIIFYAIHTYYIIPTTRNENKVKEICNNRGMLQYGKIFIVDIREDSYKNNYYICNFYFKKNNRYESDHYKVHKQDVDLKRWLAKMRMGDFSQ